MYRRSLIPIAILGLAAAGCGGSSSSSSSSSAAAPAASATEAATTAASGGGATVDASEKEWSIAVGSTAIKAGTVTFNVKNDGSFPHNLTIDGPGVADKATDTIANGATGTVTADLKAGTYELYCSIPGHKAKGMDLKITVS